MLLGRRAPLLAAAGRLVERHLEEARASKATYERALAATGQRAAITTEILAAPEFFYAEDYHQQYLTKKPGPTCELAGTGVTCPVGTGSVSRARG